MFPFLVGAALAQEVSVNPLSSLPLTRLDGTPMPASELVGKAVLFVNVASKCGYTPQYDGLQELYTAKKDQGLVIVGVPCNQFGAQEPGTKEEIAEFCRLNYGVTFPLLEKQDVNGANRSPLYRWLVASEPGANADVKWNFEKYLVDRSGKVVGHYSSKVAPSAGELGRAIDAALAP
ncbi:MAG: glutathione peroxidase [Myxococcota bacterium]